LAHIFRQKKRHWRTFLPRISIFREKGEEKQRERERERREGERERERESEREGESEKRGKCEGCSVETGLHTSVKYVMGKTLHIVKRV